MAALLSSSRVRAAMLLLCAALCGCGTSEYERRMTIGIQAMRVGTGTEFPVPDSPIKMLVPSTLVSLSYYNENAAEPGTQEPIKEARLYPPFLKLPGLRATFPGERPDPQNNNAKLWYYCYVAVSPADDTGADGSPYEEWVAKQSSSVLGAQGNWEDVSCQTPAGGSEAWRRFSVSAPQEFLGDPNVPPANVPGIFQLYMRKLGDFRVVIAWRVPEAISRDILSAAQMMAGTVTLVEAPAEAPAQ